MRVRVSVRARVRMRVRVRVRVRMRARVRVSASEAQLTGSPGRSLTMAGILGGLGCPLRTLLCPGRSVSGSTPTARSSERMLSAVVKSLPG